MPRRPKKRPRTDEPAAASAAAAPPPSPGTGQGKGKGQGKKRSREPGPQPGSSTTSHRSGDRAGKQPRAAASSSSSSSSSSLSSLQAKMRAKLDGARFRSLNEQLYTTRGAEAFESFQREPELFDVYHRGFREQVEHWPVNPLDQIVAWLKRQHKRAVVADFGCGDAQLAANVPNKVHSFDLVSTNPRVVACDMAAVPLADGSVDVAVFCLSLMGTNLTDYLREARRVLKPKTGVLKIAEVRSRFEGGSDGSGGGGGGGGFKSFAKAVQRLGFDRVSVQVDNKMFAMMEFTVAARAPEPDVRITARACVYKKR